MISKNTKTENVISLLKTIPDDNFFGCLREDTEEDDAVVPTRFLIRKQPFELATDVLRYTLWDKDDYTLG